ncbi:hypothetical protein V6N11_067810 [Hibiscus sabdariffa]|uniref:Uncharacterized protein n=1 Tax=Hibiscus sabdariffa TaxID=183260 RepID=A0ABR2SSS8_9ROSI
MGVLFQGVAPPVTNRPLPLVPVVTNDGMHLKQGIVASESEIPVINVEPPLEWHALSLTVADQQVGKRGRNIGLDIQSNSPRRSYVATISASFALPASNEQGLPFRYYTKALFHRIATVIRKVIKVDYNTNADERGKFRVLIRFVSVVRNMVIRRICGDCASAFDKEVVAVANTSPLVSGFAKNVTSSELYGPWMIVDNRKP